MTNRYVHVLVCLAFLQYVTFFGSIAFAAPLKYSEKGCDFAVWFPQTPTISKVSAGDLDVHEAELKIGVSLLRANCLPAPNRFADDTHLLKETIQDYFAKNGMVNESVIIEETSYGKKAEGRAYKKISGAWATYVTVWCVTRTSALTLSVATFSDQYPTEEISAFINSIEVK